MKQGIFIAALLLCSLFFSLQFACAAPLVAIAAMAAATLSWKRGIGVVAAAWLVNQAVGYGLLGYPMEMSSYGWGVLIGLCAAGAFAAAAMVQHGLKLRSDMLSCAVMFAVASGVYQGLMAMAQQLSNTADSFSWGIVLQVLLVNAIGLAVLMAAGYLLGLLRMEMPARLVAAVQKIR